MTMIEMNKYDDTKTNAIPTVAERLPPLEDWQNEESSSHEKRQFAHGFMVDLRDGEAHFFSEVGVHFQRVNEDTVRCVSVTDHPYCFLSLALMRTTFEAGGIVVQLDPYTVVTPYEEPPEEEFQEEIAGVEVV